MTQLHAYLTFNGNCEEAFNFYRSVLGGDFTYVGKFKDIPHESGSPSMPESEQEKIMHIALKVNDKMEFFGSDTGGEWAPSFKQGNNFTMSLTLDNDKEADQLYEKLSTGGTQTMPMSLTFWQSYFGMLTDKFGINWMLSVDKSQK